jgi:hypothetical protein
MLVRIILLRRIGRETGSSLGAPSTTFVQAVSGGVCGDGATIRDRGARVRVRSSAMATTGPAPPGSRSVWYRRLPPSLQRVAAASDRVSS